MAKKSYWLKSAVFSFSQKFFDLVLGVGSFYFLVRVLPKNEFGIWSLFITVSTIVELAKNGLVKNGLIRFTNMNDHRAGKNISGASLLLNALATLAVSIVIVGLAIPLSRLWRSPEIEYLFYLLPLVLLLLVPYSHVSFMQQAKMKFGGLFWSTFLRRSVFLLFITIVFFREIPISLPQLVIVQCISLVISTIISWYLSREILEIGFREAVKWMKELWKYGIYVFGTNLSGYLASSVDQLMVGAMLNTQSVASYNISVRILNLVEIPSNSLSAIIFPKSSQLSEIHQRKVLCEIYENSTASILAILLPAMIFVLLFPSWIVKILAGDGYSEVAVLAQITILFALFIPFMRQAGTILDSIGKAKLNFLITFLSLVINPIINYFFISKWGLIGAALATLSTYLLLFVVNQFMMWRLLGSSLIGTLKKVFPMYRKFFGFFLSYVRGR